MSYLTQIIDKHLILIMTIGAISGFLMPISVYFGCILVFGRDGGKIKSPNLAYVLIVAIISCSLVGIEILTPLYAFSLIPLLGAAPMYGLAYGIGALIGKQITPQIGQRDDDLL